MSDSNNDNSEGTNEIVERYFNFEYSNVDKTSKNIVSTNSGNFKITIFLAKKYKYTEENFIENEGAVYLHYNDIVTNIYLEDSINQIGLSGYIDVRNDSSFLDMYLGKHCDYHVVINITEYDLENNPIVKYEPYIFDISYVRTLSSPQVEDKLLRVGLVDVITGVLKTHSIASVIKEHSYILKSSSYKDVFCTILDYVKEFLSRNTNNKFRFYKDVLYDSSTMLGNGIYNGNDQGADMSDLIELSFNKMEKNSSIYEALKQLMMDCCTSIKTPESFAQKYHDIGDVLIPFFFKEEYEDLVGFYNIIWNNGNNGNGDVLGQVEGLDRETLLENANQLSNVRTNESFTKQYCDEGCKYKVRNITMRDIFMPFYLAFGFDKIIGVYENINPSSDDVTNNHTVSLNGTYLDEILSLQFTPVNLDNIKKMWKNVMVLDTFGGGGSSGSSVLLFFSWFVDYYSDVFLRFAEGFSSDNSTVRVLNVQPSFHIMQNMEKIAHGTKDDDSFNNSFDEINSYTFTTETEDSAGECLRLMGKNIASFILSNDVYEFKIRGNLLRRPNEIIKFGFRGGIGQTMQSLSMNTGIMMGDYTFMYIKKVTHHFRGSEYTNMITGTKICEILGGQNNL